MYDITIVGTGVSGIFLAYKLLNSRKDFKILMIERGNSFKDRICPIEIKKSDRCVNCKVCSKMQGFGGLLRSEGKFNYTNDFGGNLKDKIGKEKTLNLMEEVDSILCKFGAEKVSLYSTENKSLNKFEDDNFKILKSSVRHLGTNLSYEILEKMYLYIKDKIDIRLNTNLNSINKKDDVFILNCEDSKFKSKKVILATGLSSVEISKRYLKEFNIKSDRARVDLGLRIEMKQDQLNILFKDSFETKIQYKNIDIEATTYCMNPRGRVIKKYQDNLVMADGQNYLEEYNPSHNLNFTVFVPKYFNSSNEAREYANKIIREINDGEGKILVQRLKDLLKVRETKNIDIEKNSIVPTLNSYPCNLYEKIPKIYIEGALKIFDFIENIIGEKIDEDTLLYAIDAKFYGEELEVDENFETKEKGLYIIGEFSGVTYSLSQAAASGVYLGEVLNRRGIIKI